MYWTLNCNAGLWIIILVAWISSCLVHGFRDMSSAQSYELKAFLKNEGYDCLKKIIPIRNLTMDKSFTPEQEKQVLLDIYHTTNGQYWYNQSGWTTPNETSHCYWHGISCHSNTSYVKSIALPSNYLSGFLPNNLWKLRNLLALCTPANPRLYGHMEDFLFANMSKLQIIDVNGAAFDGSIPEAVGNLLFLQRIFACGMNGGMSGNLPESIGNMKNLKALCFGGNRFTGKIPRNISKLSQLGYVNIQNAPVGKMWGFIEDFLSIEAMRYLYVSGIKLKGGMPKTFPKKIRELVLNGNDIDGSLPATYPANLSVFIVANNHLTGDIPAELFFLPHIEVIDVSQNSFSSINNGGTWPSNRHNKSFVKYVSLAGNKNLSIHFQSFLDIFKWTVVGGGIRLLMINVSFCDIESPFPPNLQYITTLMTCDLRGNRLNGSIPDIFIDSIYLTYLDISMNSLTGDLPKGTESFMSLQYLDISGNIAMQENNKTKRNILQPDFSRMTKFGDNFTCPEARLTFNNGRVRLDPTFYQYRYCVCDSGFYGDNGLCKKCLPGGICQQPVVMKTSDLVPNTMKMKAGYWPSPSSNNVTHLVRCPVPKACNTHGECTCRLQTLKNLTNQSQNRSVLSLTTLCNTSCICHKGNTDRFCSRCQQGFYKSGGLCYSCPKAKDNISFFLFIPVFTVTVLVMLWSFIYYKAAPKTAFIVVVVEFLLMLVFTLLEMMPSWVLKLNVVIFVLCMTNRGKSAHSFLKIGVFYIQTLDSMVSTVDVWPRQVFLIQHYISNFWNLDFSSLSCEFSVLFSPVGKFAIILLLPLFCMLLIGLYFMISIAYNKYKHQEDSMRAFRYKCRELTISCLNFTYFPIVEATVSVLRPCDSDRGILFMPKTPWIECSSQTYHVLSLLGWLSVVFYVIGFPLILFTLMTLFFRKRPSMSEEQRNDMDSWLGSIYLSYKPKYQLYFELILVVRRLLLAFSLSFLASMGCMQTFVVWLILIVSAIVHFRLQPYQTPQNLFPFENVYEFVILLVLSMSFILLRFAALGKFTTMFVWFVMIVNGCALVGLVISVIYLLVRQDRSFFERRLFVVTDRNRNVSIITTMVE